MALQKLELRPGVNRESTSYANEGGFYASNKVRFRSGYAEKIGGWQNITNVTSSQNTYKGVARFLWNYVTTDGLNLMFTGTNQKVYVESGGVYNDITPVRTTTSLTLNPFTTTTGSRSISVNATAHGTSIGTYVSFTGASTLTVSGSQTFVISGAYEVITVPSADTFTIFAPSICVSTVTGGGSHVIATYDITAGNAVYTTQVGWGGPPWSSGGWGSNIPAGVPLRLWSGYNYGNDLVFAERGGEIYYWTKDVSTWAKATLLSTYANTITKFTTAATFTSGATTITVSDATGINTGAVVSGTGIPSGAYVLTSWAGGLTVPISAATTASATITASFSYAGRHIPTDTNVIIDSSVNNFSIAMGANPYDPTNFTTTFDPLLVRWSDADAPWEWVPEVTNQSGEQRMSHGSYIVAADNSRQELLVWTDTAIYSMQYLGPPFVWGFTLLDQDISIISQNAARTVNNVTYWMGVDKFYAYSGRVETLPCTLRQYVFGNINQTQAAQITCGHNEGYSEIWWFYPSANSFVNDSYVIYNYLERIWYYGTLNRSAWAEHSLGQYPLVAFSVQTSYLSAAIDNAQTSISLINASSYPESGRVLIDQECISYTGRTTTSLTGCVRGIPNPQNDPPTPTTAAAHDIDAQVSFVAPNQILEHERGTNDVSTGTAEAIEAYIESSDFDIQDGQTFGYVWRMIPDLTFAGSTAENPSVMLTVKARQNSGSNYTPADDPTVTRTATIPVEQYTGQVYTRVRGRQMAFRIDSTDLGVAWQMGMMRIDVRPDGRR